MESQIFTTLRQFFDNRSFSCSWRTKKDIEKFYKDRNKYSRGSTLYTKSNTLQEKVQYEFDSLHVEHDLNIIGKNWKQGVSKQINFSFWNLAGLSPFKGQISAFGAMNKKQLTSVTGRKNEDVPQGRSSHQYSFKVKPNKKGTLRIYFISAGRNSIDSRVTH